MISSVKACTSLEKTTAAYTRKAKLAKCHIWHMNYVFLVIDYFAGAIVQPTYITQVECFDIV